MRRFRTILALGVLTGWLLVVLPPPVSGLAGDTPNQALALLAAGRADDAVVLLQTQISRSPGDAAAQNLLCRTYFMQARWDPGITACEKAIALDSNNSDYHLWMGRIYGEKADSSNFMTAAGLAKKVRVEFERAVELNPANVDARADLSEFYVEAPGFMGGGIDKAVAQAQALVKLDSAKSHWVYARIAEKKKDWASAEKEYKAAIDTGATHDNPNSWFDLAAFYRHRERLADMEAAIVHACAQPGDETAVLMESAGLLIQTGRNFPGAIQLLRRYLGGQTVEAAPAFRAHYLLGGVLEKQGDKAGAVAEYRAALALYKNYSQALDALKRLGG